MLKGILKLSLGNGASKILGFSREILFAFWFGTSYIADVYRIALTIILLPTQLIVGNAFQGAFVPTYKKSLAANNSHAFLSRIIYLFIGLSIMALIAFFLFSDQFVQIISPGFSAEASALAGKIVLIMAFSIPLYFFSYLFIYISNSHGRFGYDSLASILQNVFLIITLALAYWVANPLFLGYGFVATYLTLLILLLVVSVGQNVLNKDLFVPDKDEMKVMKNFGHVISPLLVYMFFYQGNIFIERMVASKIEVGAISSIDYARILSETPAFLIALPLSTVGLTYFSGLDWEKAKGKIETILITVILLFGPLSIFYFCLSFELVQLLYMRGSFDEHSVLLTGTALTGLSLSIWALALAMFLQKIYSAYFRNKEMMILTGISLLTNVVLNFILAPSYGITGVTMAFSFSIILQACLLTARLKLKLKSIGTAVGVVASGALLFAVLYRFLELDLPVFWKLALYFTGAVLYWLVFYWINPFTRKYLIALGSYGREKITQMKKKVVADYPEPAPEKKANL